MIYTIYIKNYNVFSKEVRTNGSKKKEKNNKKKDN